LYIYQYYLLSIHILLNEDAGNKEYQLIEISYNGTAFEQVIADKDIEPVPLYDIQMIHIFKTKVYLLYYLRSLGSKIKRMVIYIFASTAQNE